jgi:hypothetical protein
MLRWAILVLPAMGLLLSLPNPTRSCSLCGANLQQAPTFRQEAAQETARLILIGAIQKSEMGTGGAGVSEFHITDVLRSDPFLAGRTVIKLKRYIPVTDPRNPPRYLVFCDVFKDELDPFRGVPIKSPDAAEYARKVFKLDPRDRTGNLLFFFRYLENPDVEVARDAFLEFAKATDQDIAQVARKLEPEKLRGWLKDARTPPERLSVYALLLGACGTADDARFLQSLLNDTNERMVGAYDGLLGGFIHLRPREGWDLALSLLRDERKPLTIRLAVARTVSFFHGAQPTESRADVLRCLEAMIVQGELADIAVEDLRRWQIHDRTREVLALYGKKGYDAPLMQRAIVRYALSCKDDSAARAFVEEHRRSEPDLIKEVEESLQFEK